jgi:hypothetical protein
VGYSEFTDKLNASKAKNLYHGWTGWGGRGLTIELTDFSMSQLTQLPGQKRLREGEGEPPVPRRADQPQCLPAAGPPPSLPPPAAAAPVAAPLVAGTQLGPPLPALGSIHWAMRQCRGAPLIILHWVLPPARRLPPADLLQPNGNFKQARPDMPPMVRLPGTLRVCCLCCWHPQMCTRMFLPVHLPIMR